MAGAAATVSAAKTNQAMDDTPALHAGAEQRMSVRRLCWAAKNARQDRTRKLQSCSWGRGDYSVSGGKPPRTYRSEYDDCRVYPHLRMGAAGVTSVNMVEIRV